jgi:glycosyltransferase involved in cell wall biosynthesis
MASLIQAAGIPVDSLNMSSGVPDPRAVLTLRRLLSQDKPDVLQAWMYHANLLASVVRPAVRAPVIWNMRAVPDVDYGRQIAVIDGTLSRLARQPAAVVVNSEHGRAYMAGHGYAGARWRVIPNGFDTTDLKPDAEARSRLRAEWGIREGQVVIGLVARLDPVKDHRTFLEAAKVLSAQDFTTQFVCVGGGNDTYLGQMRALAASLKITDRVVWAGARTDIASVNSAFDIVTCCSLSESFPNVVGEAMACGVPCVVTDVGDSARLVGNAGRVVAPRSPSALATAWQALIAGGPAFRSELGARARERILSEFSLDRIVADYEDLYSTVAQKV